MSGTVEEGEGGRYNSENGEYNALLENKAFAINRKDYLSSDKIFSSE